MTSKIKLTFLGTADSIPSARRNHSAVLLTYEGENILFDCGEGTQRQFRKAGLNPGRVTRILISHWHGDHVLGLPGLLQTLSLSGYNRKLFIYGPQGTKTFVRELLNVFNFSKNYEIVVEEVAVPKGMTSSAKTGGLKFFEARDFYLEAREMTHGIPCNAYSFVKKGLVRIDKKKLKKSGLPEGTLVGDLKKGKDVIHNGKRFRAKDFLYTDKDLKISVVFDTGMNRKIVPFVKNSNVLVSEASFGGELKKNAKEHDHLTSEQAARIAKDAKVGKLILTHISQRYENDLKKILNEAKKIFKNSEVVKDLDVVEI